MNNQSKDGLTEIIEVALAKMPEVGTWQRRFMVVLLNTVLLLRGKLNFKNLARHSELDEKTYRRWFRGKFNFEAFNLRCIEQRAVKGDMVVAMDASFIPKSGKKTFGLGKFYNGCKSRAERGLEISELALIDRRSQQAFGVSCRQTVDQQGKSRPERYAEQVRAAHASLLEDVQHLLVDGYYSKKSFVEPVCALGLDIVGKLRADADLRHLYRGVYRGQGRPKRYDGKVDVRDLSRFVYEGEVKENLHLFTQTVWHVSLKRIIRLALLLDTSDETARYVLLFSTDVELTGHDILDLYSLRFQIEFLFRDAKQLTGLCDCQARDEKALSFHFNTALSAVNLAKLQLLNEHQGDKAFVFSLSSYIQAAFNRKLLNIFLGNLDLELSCHKINAALHNALSFGLADP